MFSSSAYTITVTNGTSNPTTTAQGDTVTITANNPASRQVFDHWTSSSNGVTFSNQTNSSTTFIMPNHNVSVTAHYEYIYSITVHNGRANKVTAKAGELITIEPQLSPEQTFLFWTSTSPGVTFDDRDSPNTTFIMPSNNVDIAAESQHS